MFRASVFFDHKQESSLELDFNIHLRALTL